SPSRAQALTLEDGTVLLIGNQNVNRYDQALYLDRDPITVSVSEDGYTFNRVYALRTGSPTQFRFSGISGRNPGYAYSSSVIHEGYLYTMYSIGKEDMGITRVPLSALDLKD
ncbi:exo-alpha-sialidase, partial [Parapedobacter defluvii]|uniref:exo-alpha-sialidase n=1 Tax=Parapedobacter defluvii TaxID=2045106 RepID=UPI003340840D